MSRTRQVLVKMVTPGNDRVFLSQSMACEARHALSGPSGRLPLCPPCPLYVLRVLCDLNYSGSPAGGSRPQICLNLRNLRFLILAALSVGLCDLSFGGFWEARCRGVGCL